MTMPDPQQPSCRAGLRPQAGGGGCPVIWPRRRIVAALVGAGVTISLAMLLLEPRVQYIDAVPWRLEYIGLVQDVECCDPKNIQAAIDRVAKHGRGVINLAPGTYNFTEALNVNDGRKITLNGNGSLFRTVTVTP